MPTPEEVRAANIKIAADRSGDPKKVKDAEKIVRRARLNKLSKLATASDSEKVSEVEKGVSLKENANIANFLKAISQKNYASADKYLQGVVDSKLKASISKAAKNSK